MGHDGTEFEKDVIERSFEVPVLVDFWAAWCGPCKMLGPVLERLAAEAGGAWVLKKLDTEQDPATAARYGIRSIPAVKLFVEGRVTAEFTGALPETAVRQWLNQHLPGKFRKEVDQAEALLKSNRIEEARALLQPVVDAEPANRRARVLLAQALLDHDYRQARALIEGIEEDSQDAERAQAVRVISDLLLKLEEPSRLSDSPSRSLYLEAIQQLKKRDFGGALQRFIHIIRDDRYYDDDGSRKACIAIFKLLGEDHPTTLEYRREFSRALY